MGRVAVQDLRRVERAAFSNLSAPATLDSALRNRMRIARIQRGLRGFGHIKAAIAAES